MLYGHNKQNTNKSHLCILNRLYLLLISLDIIKLSTLIDNILKYTDNIMLTPL